MPIPSRKIVFSALLISIVLSLTNPIAEIQKAFDPPLSFSFKDPRVSLSSAGSRVSHGMDLLSLQEIDAISALEYDHYRQNCPQAEDIVRSSLARIFSQQKDAPPALLRLLFHDCFIQGCDASVLLYSSDKNYSTERDAIPNQTLRGFDVIDRIKEELERACPEVVSCADVLALATRDGILLAGGPFYPVFTGRRDNSESFYEEAMAQIPQPDDNVSQILSSFGRRGFTNRETVALLGGHNIGKIGCRFIRSRLQNFKGTGQPDPTMDPDLLDQMRSSCQPASNSSGCGGGQRASSSMATGSDSGDVACAREAPPSIASGGSFDSRYYQRLVVGRGLLFADQQLMAERSTAELVSAYASDEGSTFRRVFAKAMVRMSSLGALTGSQGQVRVNCSLALISD